MTVNGLDHVNIQTRNMGGTVRFFADVLALVPGAPPGGLDPSQITWMFDAAGRPLFHLSTRGGAAGEDAADTGALHHVALSCTGHAEMVARLDGLGLDYARNEVPAAGVRQLFVRDPNGVLLELNFREP